MNWSNPGPRKDMSGPIYTDDLGIALGIFGPHSGPNQTDSFYIIFDTGIGLIIPGPMLDAFAFRCPEVIPKDRRCSCCMGVGRTTTGRCAPCDGSGVGPPPEGKKEHA